MTSDKKEFYKTINYWDEYHCGFLENLKDTKKIWMSPDSNEAFLNLTKEQLAITYGISDITYEYNSEGFRSDEFDTSAPIKILYGGCSLTEGIGLPRKHTWASFLNDNFSKELGKPVPLFNCGRGGFSIDSIIRYVIMTIDQGFVPDLVNLLLPSPMRQECAMIDSKGFFRWYNYIPNYRPLDDPAVTKMYDAISSTTSPSQRCHDMFKSLLLLKFYLLSKNIPFYFGFWNDQVIDGLKLSNHLPDDCPKNLREHYINAEFIKDLEHALVPGKNPRVLKVPQVFKEQIGRDLVHIGPNSHIDYSNKYFEAIIQKDEVKVLLEKWRK